MENKYARRVVWKEGEEEEEEEEKNTEKKKSKQAHGEVPF